VVTGLALNFLPLKDRQAPRPLLLSKTPTIVSVNSKILCKMGEPDQSSINVKLEFGGGLELLFSNKRSHQLSLPPKVPIDNNTSLKSTSGETKSTDISYLIHHMRDHLLQERPELFMESGTVYVLFSVLDGTQCDSNAG
jgi:Urm1 (Ubiquitin related modifier)